MKFLPLIHSRRNLLKLGTLSFISASSVFSSGCDFFTSEQLTLEQRLIRLLAHQERAQEIGKALRSQDKTLKDYSLEQLVKEVSRLLNLDVNEIQDLSEKKLNKLFSERIREDFISENTVIVGSWLLSKTEAMLCVLVDVYPEPQT